MKKNILSAAIFSLFALTAQASSYLLVTPLNSTAHSNVTVSLTALEPLAVLHGESFRVDYKDAYAGSAPKAHLSWLIDGPLPAGVTASSSVLSGVALESGSFTVTVHAAFRSESAMQDYQLNVASIQSNLQIPQLPPATVGEPYSANLTAYLSTTGEFQHIPADQHWSIVSGALPAGLELTSDGRIHGTLQPNANTQVQVELKVDYRNSTATSSATVPLVKNIQVSGQSRTWSDGSTAASCNEYRNPNTTASYSGATGDGVYRIKLDSNTVDVFCDMTTEGGGWTLVRRSVQNWGPWADNLDGTATVTVAQTPSPLAAATFTIPFATIPFEDFLFRSGSNQKWLISHKSQPKLPGSTCATMVQIKKSHVSDVPYSAGWCLRGQPEDPWISAQSHQTGNTTAESDNDHHSMLYGERNAVGQSLWVYYLRNHQGLNVFIR